MIIARQVAGGVQTAFVQDAVLDFLACHPEGLTIIEVTERFRLHITTVRAHLNWLVAEERLLQRDERVGVGRLRRRYFPVPRTVPSTTIQNDYQLLAGVLTRVLDVENIKIRDMLKGWVMRTLDVGVLGLPKPSGAGWQDRVDAVLGLLGSWGCDSRVTRIEPCRVAVELCGYPLGETVFPCPEAVCGAHRGLIRGVLGVLREADMGVELEADFLGEPCCLRLSREAGYEGEKQ